MLAVHAETWKNFIRRIHTSSFFRNSESFSNIRSDIITVRWTWGTAATFWLPCEPQGVSQADMAIQTPDGVWFNKISSQSFADPKINWVETSMTKNIHLIEPSQASHWANWSNNNPRGRETLTSKHLLNHRMLLKIPKCQQKATYRKLSPRKLRLLLYYANTWIVNTSKELTEIISKQQ